MSPGERVSANKKLKSFPIHDERNKNTCNSPLNGLVPEPQWSTINENPQRFITLLTLVQRPPTTVTVVSEDAMAGLAKCLNV